MPLLSDPPIDDETTWALAALGRAPYIACEFESDCRSLAFVFKLKEPQPDIALGKIIVAVLLSRNSAEPTPTKEVINAYRKKVESWALRNDASPSIERTFNSGLHPPPAAAHVKR
jgi:hypothetical protein